MKERFCPICGKPSSKAGKTCGNKNCILELRKETCIKIYGVDNVYKSDLIQEKIKNTNRLKYGKDYYYQTDEYKIKSKLTCNKKYGVDNVAKVKIFKQKREQTCLEKYGETSHMKTDEYKNKFSQLISSDKVMFKTYQTKKKNNSFNKSKLEDKLYEILCNKYGTENVIRQYRSEVYPFVCDFYIKHLNLYIEANFSWTHGKHPFDETNEDDLKTLQKWKDKSMELNFKGEQKKYYLNAIKTWTDLDVRKRKIAKENKLNFIELYNINEFKI